MSIIVIAIAGLVGAFLAGLLVGRKNPKVAEIANAAAQEAQKKL